MTKKSVIQEESEEMNNIKYTTEKRYFICKKFNFFL